jgi:hypothetical protein
MVRVRMLALAALALATPLATARSLNGAEPATVAEDETPGSPGVANLQDAFPFLGDMSAKSRQFDFLNKTSSLRHWDPPTGGCAALLAQYPMNGAASTAQTAETLPNGDVTLYDAFTLWPNMNVRAEGRGGGVEGRDEGPLDPSSYYFFH